MEELFWKFGQFDIYTILIQISNKDFSLSQTLPIIINECLVEEAISTWQFNIM